MPQDKKLLEEINKLKNPRNRRKQRVKAKKASTTWQSRKKDLIFFALSIAILVLTSNIWVSRLGNLLGRAIDYEYDKLAMHAPITTPYEKPQSKQEVEQLYSKETLLELKDKIVATYTNLLSITELYHSSFSTAPITEEYETYEREFGLVNYDHLSSQDCLELATGTLYPIYNNILEAKQTVLEKHMTTLVNESSDYRKMYHDELVKVVTTKNKIQSDLNILRQEEAISHTKGTR